MPRFEEAVSHYCGVRHGVAVNGTTSALHIAYLALDLGPAIGCGRAQILWQVLIVHLITVRTSIL